MRTNFLISLTLLVGCSGPEATNQPESGLLNTYYDYQLYSGIGQLMAENQARVALSQFDVILVGEWHTHPGVHLFQTRLLQSLHAENQDIALSMEQFSRDKQTILNQYLNGEIGEQTLISEGDGWPNYESDYRPLVEYAKARKLDVIAANAPKQLVRCIAQEGLSWLDTLPAEQRINIAEQINSPGSAYKEKFMASLHHGKPEDNQNNYSAQIAWDETMAESITQYLNNHPGSKVLHIAGKFHTEDGLGIAASIKQRRPNTSIAIITPVTEVSAETEDFQLLVLNPPIRYVKKHNKINAIHKLITRKRDIKCTIESD